MAVQRVIFALTLFVIVDLSRGQDVLGNYYKNGERKEGDRLLNGQRIIVTPKLNEPTTFYLTFPQSRRLDGYITMFSVFNSINHEADISDVEGGIGKDYVKFKITAGNERRLIDAVFRVYGFEDPSNNKNITDPMVVNRQ